MPEEISLTPATIFLVAIAIVLGFLAAVPLSGVLVRFRANYTPKGLQLDGEGGVQPHTGPVIKSYFGMLKRVVRLEGRSGLFKGFMPNLIATVVSMAFVAVLTGVFLNNTTAHKKYTAPVDGPWHRLAYSLFMTVIALPVVIITNRSITTPFKLPWFNALYSLRLLLTRTERRRPWVLFFTPGLLISEMLRIMYVTLIMDPLRNLILPRGPRSDDDTPAPIIRFTLARLSLHLGLIFISTIIICSLEVVSTRLSIQRNHATSGFSPIAEEEDLEIVNNAVYSGTEEDVIGLRNEDDPYIGFVDCVKRIVNEEGYRTLFRAWWLVFLQLAAIAFL